MTTSPSPVLNATEIPAEQVVNELSANKPAGRRVKLAYLTTEYPKASHTFVRREIIALEDMGYDILRISIRGGSAHVDPADADEAAKTVYCLGQKKTTIIGSFVRSLVSHPHKFMRAVRMSMAMWATSDRGWLRHTAYLVEACVLYWILRRNKIEHVHVHFGKNAADVARLIHVLGGPTYSMTIHGPGEFDAPRGFSLGPKVEDSQFTVAISSYGTAQLRRWVSHEHWNKLHVVRCTINEDFLSQRQPLKENTNQFVCIGRLTGQKGQLLLVEALAQVVAEGRDVHLVLAGDGEMRDVIEQRIQELNLTDHVTITGWIGEADVRRYLLESRSMILPSFAEGLPVAIMEAMALGRTVISTCITGIPELLRDGENGWQITAGCCDSIADAIRQSLDTDINRLNEMGLAGHNRVARQHHAKIEAAKLDSLFNEFVE